MARTFIIPKGIVPRVTDETFAFESFRLTPGARILREGGTPVNLGSRALDLLIALVKQAGTTVSKSHARII
jgi:DNA-binding winged helix-turn-helix (wHTH) protein